MNLVRKNSGSRQVTIEQNEIGQFKSYPERWKRGETRRGIMLAALTPHRRSHRLDDARQAHREFLEELKNKTLVDQVTSTSPSRRRHIDTVETTSKPRVNALRLHNVLAKEDMAKVTAVVAAVGLAALLLIHQGGNSPEPSKTGPRATVATPTPDSTLHPGVGSPETTFGRTNTFSLGGVVCTGPWKLVTILPVDDGSPLRAIERQTGQPFAEILPSSRADTVFNGIESASQNATLQGHIPQQAGTQFNAPTDCTGL